MCATFSLNLFVSGIVNNNWYSLDQPGLVNFGVFRVSVGLRPLDHGQWK